MSFDVFLKRFEAGMPAEVRREPVRAVLQAIDFTGPDEFGFYIVTFPDGVEVEFSAKGLDGKVTFDDCAFFIRGMSPHLVKFIFDVAKAGNMVILPAMEDFVPILTWPAQRQELPPDLTPEPVLCESPAELESLLRGGFTGWKKYRDQVLGKGRGT